MKPSRALPIAISLVGLALGVATLGSALAAADRPTRSASTLPWRIVVPFLAADAATGGPTAIATSKPTAMATKTSPPPTKTSTPIPVTAIPPSTGAWQFSNLRTYPAARGECMLAGTVTGDGRTADGIWLRGVFLPVGVSNQYTGGMWRYPVGGGYTIDFQFPYSLDGVTQIAAQALNPDGNATIATSPYISVCVN